LSEDDPFELDAADRELEARLRATFAAQRPRPAFAVGLRDRLKPRPSLWQRLFGAPALRTLAPVFAVLLVVVGVLALLGTQPRGGASTTSGSAPAFQADSQGGGFGVLPGPGQTIPTLSGGQVLAPSGAQSSLPAPAPGARSIAPPLTAAGTPAFPAQAPVYRYALPTGTARTAALAAIASRSGLQVLDGSPSEPSYLAVLSEPVRSGQLADAASAFLAAHGLGPGFQSLLKLGLEEVVYERIFSLPDGTSVPQVTLQGVPAGTRVVITGGHVSSVSGPLELPLEQATYPLLPIGAVSSRLPPQLATAVPSLVYVAVPDPDGSHGYFEPAYLFSGAGGSILLAAVPTRRP